MAANKEHKIVITTDGKETIALLYRGRTVVESAVSKCNPEDTFDFVTGASLAFDRLVKEVTKKAEFKPGDRCKVVDNTCNHHMKIGDIVTLTDKSHVEHTGWHYKEHWGYIVESDIIHYVEDTKATEKPVTYKAGDKVKVIDNTCHHNTPIGNIITLKSFYETDVWGDKWWYEESTCYIRHCDFEMYQPVEDQLYTGKVICVKSGFPEYCTVGKVYKVENGVCYSDTKSSRRGITSKNLNHIGSNRNEFIPYIEAESDSEDTPKTLNCKVICTANHYGISCCVGAFTVGKIYEVKDGKITGDNNWNGSLYYDSIENLCIGLGNTFIPLVEDKPSYYNGKVVCVDNAGNSSYTKGKAYKFKDGVLTDDTGFEMCDEHPVKTFAEWDKWSTAKWLEVIE